MIAIAALLAAAAASAAEGDYDRLDARGFWVADTASEPRRPLRLAYPAAGGGWDAGLLVDVARNPLMEEVAEGVREPLVDLMASTHAFAGVAWRGMRLDVAVPVTLYGHDPGGGFAAAGDVRLGAVLPLVEPRAAAPGLAFVPSAWLPTGTATRWSGSPGPAAGAVLAMAQEVGPLGWTVNAGLRVARAEEARNLVAGGGPVGGAELHLSVVDALAVGAGVAVQGATGWSSWPLEAEVRASWRTRGGGFAVIGFAHGIGDGVGASGGRVYFGAGYGPRPPAEPPPPVVVPVVLTRREVVEAVHEDDGAPVAELVDDRIVVSEQVFFVEDSAEILPESEAVLEAVRRVLADHPEIDRLLVQGHTNSRGSRRYNRRLSARRARAVVRWLVDHGIDRDHLVWEGLGEEHPLVPDSHPDAMQLNRRVEFIVLRSDERDVPPRVPSLDELPVAARNSP